MSLLQKSFIPAQKEKQTLTISSKNTMKAVSAGTGVGFIAAFLPGFGSSQAAILATNIVGDISDEGFLVLVGGINTANMLISIATAYALDKARNGAIVIVNELMGVVDFNAMMLFLGVSIVAGAVGALLTLVLSRVFSKVIVKVNYTYMIWSIMVFITLLTFYFDGFLGLIILFTSTAIGLMTSVWGVGKNHLMGCLVLPVILYFVM
jgi:putative membrane protein